MGASICFSAFIRRGSFLGNYCRLENKSALFSITAIKRRGERVNERKSTRRVENEKSGL